MANRRSTSSTFLRCLCMTGFGLCLLTARLPAQATLAALNELPETPAPQTTAPESASPAATAAEAASIHGNVVDTSNAVIVGATVTLENAASHEKMTTTSNQQGAFALGTMKAGTYTLTIQAAGFAPFTRKDVLLRDGESAPLPLITLQVASVSSTVRVTPQTQFELAQAQVKEEEKQRFLYVIPNFYVIYDPHPAPLTAKQKMGLALRLLIDPYVFIATGAVAGGEQATDTYNGYGQEAGGYAKRYAAAYGNAVSNALIGNGLLPALLRQDPRYYYKGTGSVRSRIGYALLTIVRIKGDNGRWQPNYSGLLGNFASGAISNSYLDASDRAGIVTVTQNALIGFAFQGLGALEQEFLFRHLTTHSKDPGTVGHE